MQTHILLGFVLLCVAAGQAVHQDLLLGTENEKLKPCTLEDVYERATVEFFECKKPGSSRVVRIGDLKSLTQTGFKWSTSSLQLLVHGWLDSKDSKSVTAIRDAYLSKDNCIVAVVDWRGITNGPYTWATKCVRPMGRALALMLDYLFTLKVNPDRVTMVGDGLGAHVVGVAGNGLSTGKVNYIVGLNPTMRKFETANSGDRITKDDGKHVKIIHTDVHSLRCAIGNSDFYVAINRRPGPNETDLMWTAAAKMFAKSIVSPDKYVARQCPSFEELQRGLCEENPTAPVEGTTDLTNVAGSYYLVLSPEELKD